MDTLRELTYNLFDTLAVALMAFYIWAVSACACAKRGAGGAAACLRCLVSVGCDRLRHEAAYSSGF